MAGKGGRSYLKDLRNLYVNIGESTSEQASISSVCGRRLEVLLTPNEGPYAHAMFTLEIVASDNYPRNQPELRFLTPIFHPNIHPKNGCICLSILDDWNSCYSLLDVIKAVLFLLSNPNFDSSNNEFADLPSEYQNRFDEVCRQFLAGFHVRGEVFPANEKWCEWARANNCFPVPKSGYDEFQPLTQSTSVITSADEDVSTTPTLKKHLKAKVKAQLSDLDLESDHMSLSTPSTSVPSVANVRYSVCSSDSSQFNPFPQFWIADFLQTQRILLYQQEHTNPRIFYFCDYLGCWSCQSRKEPVYFGNETDIETTGSHQSTCQSSSFLTWITYAYGFFSDGESSSSSHTPLSCIAALFKDAKDAYELFPNCGNYVLCALFAEPRSKPKPPEEEDPLAGSVTLEDFFNLSCEFECVAHPDDSHQSVLAEDEEENEGTGAEEEAEESISESAGTDKDSLNYLYARSYRLCRDCDGWYDEAFEKLQKLKPAEWIFFQTRWPPLLAPQQVLDLEENYPAHIPFWRGSTARLVRDVVHFCRQNPKSDCLLLLDPLALSPWSPVLNALCPLTVDPSSSHRPSDVATKTTCRQRWMSLLWLTAVDTFRLTWLEPRLGSQGSRWLHAVARLALLSNWLAWFSRVEIAAVLGQSRRQSGRLLCEGLATACLHPAILGCGQAPLFDVWPLWLARLLLRCSCGLLVRLCAGRTTRCYFPLSDTDEI